MAIVSGTAFLLDLHRRALADGRLHVFEATATAAIFGVLATVRFDEYGVARFGGAALIGGAMASAAAVWCAISAGALHYARAECAFHIRLTLLESGLLYLALEHEPAELLPALRKGRHWSRLAANPAGSLSFAARMDALLRNYPACAKALGYPPYPAWCRLAGLALVFLLLGLLLISVYCGWSAVLGIFGNAPDGLAAESDAAAALSPLHTMRVLLTLCGALYLLRATLGQAQREGAMLALVETLHGEVLPGRAMLTRI